MSLSFACHNKKGWFFEFKTFLKHNDFYCNLVLTRVLNLQGDNPVLTQALASLSQFFVQVIFFYKPTWASFTFTCLSPIETLSSFIKY
jgi:hypothetical protein